MGEAGDGRCTLSMAQAGYTGPWLCHPALPFIFRKAFF